MDVREAMSVRPVTVAPGETISEAAALMRRGRFRHLPVVEDGALVGVVSERDLHSDNGPASDDVRRQRPVRSVMTADVITIGPADPIEQAARLMLENKVGCLPVIEGEALTGIITEADIFRAFVQVLGVMEPGTRVRIRTKDFASAMARVAEVAKARGVRVITIVSEAPGEGSPSGLVVRFGTVMIAPLVTALRNAALEVDEPEPGLAGSTP